MNNSTETTESPETLKDVARKFGRALGTAAAKKPTDTSAAGMRKAFDVYDRVYGKPINERYSSATEQTVKIENRVELESSKAAIECDRITKGKPSINNAESGSQSSLQISTAYMFDLESDPLTLKPGWTGSFVDPTNPSVTAVSSVNSTSERSVPRSYLRTELERLSQPSFYL